MPTTPTFTPPTVPSGAHSSDPTIGGGLLTALALDGPYLEYSQ